MDFTKLNPWNWFAKEEGHLKDLKNRIQLPRLRGEAPCGALDHLHAEVDRLFDAALKEFGFGKAVQQSGGEALSKPQVDIGGTEKEYTVTAEMPGMDEKDISIDVQGDTLILRGEKKQEKKSEEKEGYYRVERRYGSFQRLLSLPADGDTDNIKAKYTNGVLTVTIPRKALPENTSKRIQIDK